MRKYEEMVRKYEATKELYKLAKVEREEGAEELEAFSIKYEKLEAAQTIKYDTFRDAMEQAPPQPAATPITTLLQPPCCCNPYNHPAATTSCCICASTLLQPYNHRATSVHPLQPFTAVH